MLSQDLRVCREFRSVDDGNLYGGSFRSFSKYPSKVQNVVTGLRIKTIIVILDSEVNEERMYWFGGTFFI